MDALVNFFYVFSTSASIYFFSFSVASDSALNLAIFSSVNRNYSVASANFYWASFNSILAFAYSYLSGITS